MTYTSERDKGYASCPFIISSIVRCALECEPLRLVDLRGARDVGRYGCQNLYITAELQLLAVANRDSPCQPQGEVLARIALAAIKVVGICG